MCMGISIWCVAVRRWRRISRAVRQVGQCAVVSIRFNKLDTDHCLFRWLIGYNQEKAYGKVVIS
jgi:hypothetical protein